MGRVGGGWGQDGRARPALVAAKRRRRLGAGPATTVGTVHTRFVPKKGEGVNISSPQAGDSLRAPWGASGDARGDTAGSRQHFDWGRLAYTKREIHIWWPTERFVDRRPSMGPKRKAESGPYRVISADDGAVEHGWPYKVREDGQVTVGTSANAPYKRFTFKLTTYPSSSSDEVGSCLEEEFRQRRSGQSGSQPFRLPGPLGCSCCICSGAEDASKASPDAAPMDVATQSEDPVVEAPATEELDEIRRELFNELGDVGAAAAAAAAFSAAATTATTAATTATTAATAATTASDATTALSKRGRTEIQRFDPVHAERGGGGWSEYDLSRIGQRHGRVRDQSYEEVRTEARALRAQMDSLLELVRAPERNFNALMERVAAMALHQAALDEAGNEAAEGETADSAAVVGDPAGCSAARSEAEVGTSRREAAGSEAAPGKTAADRAAGGEAAETSAAAGTTAVRTAGAEVTRGQAERREAFQGAVCAGTPCSVEIRQHDIGFILPEGQQPVDSVPLVLPLELVQGVNVADSGVGCVVSLMGQEPLELSFPPRSAFDAMQKTNVKTRDRFVRMLDGALAAAREACAGLAAAREARPVAAQTAARVAPAAPPQMPRDAAPPRKESARERKGRELRELLKRVSKLHSAHKTKEAEQLLESAAEGSDGSRSLAVKRAQQLRRELFTYGGLELTRSTLAEFLNLCEVKLLLPERTRKARQEMTDSKTARELLEAASSFLHGVLGSKGRRSDEDRNAFWASVVSLMPRDLVNKRKVAAAMRLLKVQTTRTILLLAAHADPAAALILPPR